MCVSVKKEKNCHPRNGGSNAREKHVFFARRLQRRGDRRPLMRRSFVAAVWCDPTVGADVPLVPEPWR